MMKLNLKKLIVTATAASVLIVGAVGVVGAQDTTPENPPAFQANGPRPMPFDGNLMEVLQRYTGLTTDELRTALAEGQTIAALIEANGESPDAFIDEMLADAEARWEERINTPFEPRQGMRERGPGRGGMIDMGQMNETIETYTGLTPQETVQALRDGSTVAELVEANGASVEDLINELVAAGEARIDEAVANERITAEAAEELKANLRAGIEARVNGERGFFGGPGGPRGGF